MADSSTSPNRPPLYVTIFCKGVKTTAALQLGGTTYRCLKCGRRVKVVW